MAFPSLLPIIYSFHIPQVDSRDTIVWSHEISSCLSLKNAYKLVSKHEVKRIWSRFFSIVTGFSTINSLEDYWYIINQDWSKVCKNIISPAVIQIINGIWFARNQIRFKDILINWSSCRDMICSNISLTIFPPITNSNMREFVIFKGLFLHINPFPPSCIKDILWQPLLFGWIKGNSDGVATGTPDLAACGGIGNVGSFSNFNGDANATDFEFIGAMMAVDLFCKEQLDSFLARI